MPFLGEVCKLFDHSFSGGILLTWYISSFFALAGKPSNTINTKGENINICWSPNGHTIAVGNKVHVYMT